MACILQFSLLLLSLPLSERAVSHFTDADTEVQRADFALKDPKQDEKLNLTINPFPCQTTQSPEKLFKELLGSSL